VHFRNYSWVPEKGITYGKAANNGLESYQEFAGVTVEPPDHTVPGNAAMLDDISLGPHRPRLGFQCTSPCRR
jgi:hypothetical protein